MTPANNLKREFGQERFFKRLLVAVDSSAQASFAVEEATRLADQLGADVVLVHVFSVAFVSSPESIYLAEDIRKNCVVAGDALLTKTKQRMSHVSRVQMVLAEGDPADEILKVAAQYEADLIVMGTHARGRIAQAVIGSVARNVTKHARCPVLTVAHPRLDNRANKPIDVENHASVTA